MTIQGGQVSTLDPYSEQLATLPDVTRRKSPGDGTQPGGSAGTRLQTQGKEDDAPAGPTIESLSPDKLFKVVEELVRSQDRLARNRWAIDLHFSAIRLGLTFSRLDKVPNANQWIQKFPNGFSKQSFGATPNKADDLCNKIEDTLMADPPKADPGRHVDEESARQAAELVAQVLQQDGGEAGTNDNEAYRWALNNALGRASSLLHYRTDPSGGGYRPLQKLAHPQATDANSPMVAEVNGIPEVAVNPILRYVSADGQFVDDASQADRVWLPKIVIDRLRREQARTFPYNAPPESAAAIILIQWGTLADARTRWPKTVGQMDSVKLQGLSNWRPAMGEQMTVPFAFIGLSGGGSGPSVEEAGTFSPLLQKRMFWYRIYIKASPEYPKGFWADLSGTNGGVVLDQGDLEYTVKLPTGGSEPRCRQLPLVQIRPWQDVDGGDPSGWPIIARFAGASEAQATLYAAFADLCDNMLHPHVIFRSVVSVDEDDWADRTVPIVLGPQDQAPVWEQFPTLPPVMEFLDRNNTAMDTASGLTATAQGLDSSNSVSGVSKQLSVRQALVSMSGIQQNLHAGCTRGWNIKCELMQSDFSTPMLIRYTGENTSSEETWWTGEDFAGIDRIGIQPGTGTMMTPEGKAQYVAFLQTQQWLNPSDAADVALPGIRNDLGIPQDPAVAAIERSVATWLQGPQDGWVEAQTQYAQQKQAYDAQQQQIQQQQQQAQQAQLAQQQQAMLPPAPPSPQQVSQQSAQDHGQQMQADTQKAQAANAQAQQSASQQQQADAQSAERKHEQSLALAAQQHQQAIDLENHKAQLAMVAEQEKHRMALEAAAWAAAIAPPPEKKKPKAKAKTAPTGTGA